MSNNWQPNNSYEKRDVEFYQTGIIKKRIETYKANGNLYKRTTAYAPDGSIIHSGYETISMTHNSNNNSEYGKNIYNINNNYYINNYETNQNTCYERTYYNHGNPYPQLLGIPLRTDTFERIIDNSVQNFNNRMQGSQYYIHPIFGPILRTNF